MADIFDAVADEPEGDIFDQISAIPNPNLSAVRRRYIDELNDPETVSRLYSLTHREVGGQGPEAQRAFMETVLNRAAARKKSLTETVNDPNYYPRQSLRPAGLGSEDIGRYGQLAADVLGGSNVSNYATGNASGNVGFAGGPQTFKAGGERFGIEGPDRNWAEEIQRFTSKAQLIAGTPTAASVQAAQGDIFDQVAAEPKGDVFDQVVEEAEPTPTPTPAPALEGGGFLERMQAMFAGARPATTEEYGRQAAPVPPEVIERLSTEPPPEETGWAREIEKPIRGVAGYVSEMIPQTKEDWIRAAGVPTDWSDPRQVAGLAYPFLRGPGGIDLPEHVKQRAEAVQAAEQTPPWSQERWSAGLGPVLDIGGIPLGFEAEGAAAAATRRPRAEPLPPLPEAMRAREEAALRAAVKGPEAPTEVIPETARVAPAAEGGANIGDSIQLAEGFGRIRTIRPDGRIEVRLDKGGIRIVKPDEISTIPPEEVKYATQIEEPRTLPQHEIRPRMGQEAPLLREPEGIAREEVPGRGPAPEAAARERVGLTVDEARQIYDETVAESNMTPEQMAAHRGMSEAYQAKYPYAAEYNIKHAQEVAAIPFEEHLAKLKKAGKLQEAPAPEAQVAVAPEVAAEVARESPRATADPQHFIGGVIPDNPRLPIFTTTERTGAEWYARERGKGGQVHQVSVEATNPLKLFNEQQVRDGLLPILDEAGVKYKYDPSTPSRGWDLEIPDIAKHSPYHGENHLDVAYIPKVREAMVRRGYDSIQASDVLEQGEIPTTVLIKDPSQLKRQPPKPPAPTAAVPPEPVIPESEARYTREAAEARATSVKNVVTAGEREARGIAPAEQAAVRDFGTVWDDAATVAQKDPEIGRRLVDELQEKPRPLSDTEDALLLRRQIEVQNEHDAAIRAVNESPGDPLAEARLASARDQAQKVYDAGKSAGTETGRGLNARKMLAANDFSLVKMEAETRAVANGGRPLSKPQLDEVKALHERIATAEAKVAGFEAKEAFEAALKEAKAASKTQGFKVQDFLDRQAQAARERIVARRGKLYADPIGVTQVAHLADEAIIGASHIVRGVTKFADWSATMIREFGENIKPFLKDLYKRAQAIASEGTKTSKLTPEERMQRALAGDVKRILTRTEQVKEKLRKGEFEKPVRKPPRMSPEKSTAMYQYAKAKEAYHHALIKAQRAARPMWRKAVGGVEEAVATARAVKTAYDLSAVLRQGGAQVMAHPIRSRNAFARMIESLKSDEGMFRINEEIKSRPNAQNGKYAQYKLFLADPEVGASLGKMEEVYASRLAKHIPGVRMSERGYVTFLNVMRADSMDALINAFETPTRKLTLQEGRALANYVNIATGRGNLGKLGAAARPLSLGLFAPRYMLSRMQYLMGQPLWGGSMRTRMLIAREYGQTAMGVGLIVALGLAAGATTETDSKSTDFGKLKFGNTRIDPWFGLQQHMVYLSRLWTGKRKTAEGKIVAVRGPKAKYGEADITGRFLRSKAAPVPGAIMDLYYGKDYVGNQVTPLSAAKNLVSPLSMEDIFKVMVEQGVPAGTAMGLLSFFGMGVSTYAPRKKKFKAGPVKNPYPEGTGRVSP